MRPRVLTGRLSCYPGHLRGLDERALADGLARVDAVLYGARDGPVEAVMPVVARGAIR